MSVFDLNGKIALVSGGYGHLGSAMVRGLSTFGATVHVLGRSEDKFSQRFKDEIAAIQYTDCDIAQTDSLRKAFADIFEQHGAIDILVNNAMYYRGQDPLEIPDEDFAYSLDGTLGSVYRSIREVVPFFRRNGRGKIINISSMYGMLSPRFEIYAESPRFFSPPHYGAAKAGVIQLTRYFAQYLGPDNIQVNAISPGPFPSDAVQKDRKFVQALENRTALHRIGRPEDLIGAVVYLSSPAADFVTGHNLVVDGGWTIT